jgi:acyl-CoA thioesterase-2
LQPTLLAVPEPTSSYLLDLLDLEPIDRDILRARNHGEGGGRLFGGQVAAQALRAASATVDVEQRPNSLHAYFLRPGRYGIPITYVVDRIRDGSSFTTRRVVALQDGEAILNLDASYHRDEPGDEYQTPSVLDATDPPDDRQRAAGPPASRPHRRAFEMRETVVHAQPTPARAVWVRASQRLPDDPDLHACVITFLSDMGPVGAVRRSVGGGWPGRGMSASLDHCVWFHRPARADDWLLYRLDAVAAAGARGVAKGEVWTRDGHLVATIMQEALVRPPK